MVGFWLLSDLMANSNVNTFYRQTNLDLIELIHFFFVKSSFCSKKNHSIINVLLKKYFCYTEMNV
jgi:hypothetical protein